MKLLPFFALLSLIFATLSYGECLQYEVDGVNLTGRVALKEFWGPPNYGESPATDSPEIQVLLQLDQPICVSKGSTELAKTRENISAITLVPAGDMKFSALDGKKISVTGNLFPAHTGHHHTDVLMQVSGPVKLIK